MRKIALYVRVSTKEAARRQEGSLKAQIERLKMRTEDKNRYNEGRWGNIVDTYKDEARSGKDTNRPDYQRLKRDIEKGRVNTVMVTELSRINRSVIDFLEFMNFCKKHDADFVCLQYDFDTTTPMGKMLITIMAALYEFEREQIIERQKNNNWVRAIGGLRNGGSPLLGYDKDPSQSGVPKINESEAETVRMIFRLLDHENITLNGLVRRLKKLNVRNKKWITRANEERGGNPFSRTSLYELLKNPAYIGFREINRVNRDEDQNQLKEEDRYQIVQAKWQPIVDKTVFDRVQALLERNREGRRDKTYRNHDFILTGVLYCDECGRPLAGKTRHGATQKHFYYGHADSKETHCRVKSYPAVRLEELVLDEIGKTIGDTRTIDDLMMKLLEMTKGDKKQFDSLLQRLKREIEEAEGRKKNLLNVISYHSEAGQMRSILDELKKLDDEIASLERRATELKQEKEASDPPKLDKNYILRAVKKLTSKDFEKTDLANKKALIRELIASIHIHPDNLVRVNVWDSGEHSIASPERSTSTTPGQALMPFQSAPSAAEVAPFVFRGVIPSLPYLTRDLSKSTFSNLNNGTDPLPVSDTDGVVCVPIVRNGWADRD